MNLYWGDNLEHLQFEDDNSIDAVVTDPPYGLSFMNKHWDYDVPSVELWREVLRVLKPGGHLLSFGGTRTYHRMVVNIEDAGFEVRDQLAWIFGSGFPKSLNIKDGEFKGFGTALKPAQECIVLCRKPIEKGLTVAENVLKWGVGALNVDGCRIGPNPEYKYPNGPGGSNINTYGEYAERSAVESTQGRWPANVLFDEEAAEVLDAQSIAGGIHSAGKGRAKKENFNRDSGIFGIGHAGGCSPRFEDGENVGASRFFYVAKTSKRERNAGLEGMPCKFASTLQNVPKDFKSEGRNARKDGSLKQNFHPTVKPIKLMEYLCKLITPPGGAILDPFMGSGSTGCAATKLGFRFIGIELEKEYFEIAKKRIAYHQKGKR